MLRFNLQRLFVGLMICLSLSVDTLANEPLIVSLRQSMEEFDQRHIYGNQLIHLALEKTVDSHGPFIETSVPGMQYKRAIKSIETNRYPNFFYGTSYSTELDENPLIKPIAFPIELGLLSHRVCFYHKSYADEIDKAFIPENFGLYTHGQGPRWIDNKILRHNGFKVTEVATYEMLFNMLNAKRFALFCRGAHEIYQEFVNHPDLENIAIENNHLLFYPMPVFFVYNKENEAAAKRIEEGLLKAYADKSLHQLLFKHFGQGLEKLHLSERKVVTLANPFVAPINDKWKEYILEPQRDLKVLSVKNTQAK